MKNEITNTRLFDLVRFMRAELHQAELITDEEYVWLCSDAPLATCKEGGSPSRRRLEDYDDLRKRYELLEWAVASHAKAVQVGEVWEVYFPGRGLPTATGATRDLALTAARAAMTAAQEESP